MISEAAIDRLILRLKNKEIKRGDEAKRKEFERIRREIFERNTRYMDTPSVRPLSKYELETPRAHVIINPKEIADVPL